MTDPVRDRLQASLGAAYTIEQVLSGGMSRVYVAEERSLARRVVIKTLPPDIVSSLSVERFQREIALAARLQHPNIVPVHTAGECDGIPYYTMPWIRGESLRDRLSHGALPVRQAVRILTDVARALAFAHREGIVHRDIKPENVLLTDGIAVVTDFGIAKALSAASVFTAGDTLTQSGVALGTPAYMSPEQVAADPAVDHRADLYAWGCVAYELLTGSSPFAGRAPAAIWMAHVTETPPSLAERRPDAPERLVRLVMSTLEKDPAARPQNADEVLRELTEVVQLGDEARSQPSSGDATATLAARDTRPSVAVLPLVNIGADAQDEFFADGMTEEIIGALARTRVLRVSGRASSFALKGTTAAAGARVTEVAARLGVGSLLTGSVRRAGARVRIAVELTSVPDEFALWSERFERDLTDIFAVQDEIASAIAAALQAKLLTPDPSGGAARPPVNAEAYALFLKGRYLMRQLGHGGLERARDCFDRVLQLDPSFALAHVGHAEIEWQRAALFLETAHVAMPRVRAAACAALAVDEHLPDAHALLGLVQFAYDWKWDEARRTLDHAIALDPDNQTALVWHAILDSSIGRHDEAVARARRVAQLDPIALWPRFILGAVYAFAARYAEAISSFQEALDLNPTHHESLRLLGWAELCGGRPEAAVGWLERAVELSRRVPLHLSNLAQAYAGSGRMEEATSLVTEILAAHDAGVPQWFPGAQALLAVGRLDEGFEWLARAADAREWVVMMTAVNHVFDPYRADPRFRALIREIGTPGSGEVAERRS